MAQDTRISALATAVGTAIKNLQIRSGAGTPEGTLAAPVGAIYRRTDGGVGTTLYIKESGTGNTGWRAVAAGGGATPSLAQVLATGNQGDSEQSIQLDSPAGDSNFFGGVLINTAPNGQKSIIVDSVGVSFNDTNIGGHTVLQADIDVIDRTLLLPKKDGTLAVVVPGEVPVFIQQTQPSVFGPAIWYQTDGTGALIKTWIQTS